MCYSAQVLQSLKDYLRQFEAVPDHAQTERLLQQRLTDIRVRIPRGFERNFDSPTSPEEERIKDLIDRYRATTTSSLEQEIFKQRKRLVDAERKLKVRETKAARSDQRIATAKIEVFLEKLSLLNGTQPHPDDNRIFPMTYSPIVVNRGGMNVVTLARYHLRQNGKPASIDRESPGLYNARRDNLERYWRREFGSAHAMMVVDSFYENVERDGKNLVLHFNPRPAQRMLVACLYAQWSAMGQELLSFAAVTDEPPAEIAAAGHDRCVINIKTENVERWLSPGEHTAEELQGVLSDKQCPYYDHEIEVAA